jgi:flagellar M-ring protein FliF
MADGVEQTAGAKALAVVASARGRFEALPAQRRNWVLAGGALLLAVVAGMAWYAQRPDWRVLFSGLEGRDASQVAQELGAAGIPFEMTVDGGGVEVPAESLDKARMEVAAKGMPASGRLGFELFDKPNWVGSEFDERVNYQRALEGELEHTIGTLGVVRSARVHLVLPQASLFTSEQKAAKASVVLKLKKSSLDPEQTESIRNLVAGAVENLGPAQVTLVDADGRVNLQVPGRGAIAGDEERQLEGRLVAMLEPMAGAGNVRATVNVSYDEGSEERTDEVYDPAQTATLSMQKSEQVSGAARVAQGVPGTASNTPAAAPAGAVQGSEKAAAPGTPPLLQPAAGKDGLPVYPQSGNGQGQTMKEENGTYAVSRHVVHSEEGPGRLRRITAAVVVNDRMTVEGAGKAAHETWKPRTTDEMRRLEQLAQAAVGFDEKRGDQVVMENVSFTSNTPEAAPAGMEKVLDQAKGLLTTQPALLKTGMMGLLGAMVVMLVLKPVAGQMVVAMRGPEELEGGRGEARLLVAGYEGRAEEVRESAALSAGNAPVAPKVVAPEQTTAVMEEVTGHIRREPVHSTRLLESWLSAGGDE